MTLIIAVTFNVNAQRIDSPNPFQSYYYDYKIANPAFTATKDKHTIMSVYSGLPGSSLEMAYGTYELNLTKIKSGAGFIAGFEEIGPHRFAHYGLFYSKRLQLSETNGFYFGTQLFYQSTKIDYTKYRLIFPDDPLLPQPTSAKTNYANVDLGLVYYSLPITIGASIKNVIKNDEQTPTFNLIVSRDFVLTTKLKATPSVFIFTDFKDTRYHFNSTFEIINWIMVGAGYTFPHNGRFDDVSFNLGINIKDWVHIITHVYSSEQQGNDSFWFEEHQRWMETIIRVRIPDQKKF